MQNLAAWPVLALFATLFNVGAHAAPFLSSFLRRLSVEVFVRIFLANFAISIPLLDVFAGLDTGFASIKGIINVVLIVTYAALTMSVIDRPLAFIASLVSLVAAVLIVCALRKQLKMRSCPACAAPAYVW